MAKRTDLQALLENILGSRNVYFQPPENVMMSYPAIVYNLANIDNKHADNKVYMQNHAYELTLIHYDPDNDIKEKLASLPMCRFLRPFTSDNLNHYMFTLYY